MYNFSVVLIYDICIKLNDFMLETVKYLKLLITNRTVICMHSLLDILQLHPHQHDIVHRRLLD